MPRILKKCHFSDRKIKMFDLFLYFCSLGFFQNHHSYQSRDANFEKMSLFRLENQKCKKEQNKKKSSSIFRKCEFPLCKGHNFGHVAAPKKGENGALSRDGFCECMFYQGGKPNFDKEAILTKTWKNIKKKENCPKIHLARNGSPKYRKQSTWRGCPTATDAPDLIFRQKLMKIVDFWRSIISEKTNARRRILQ